MKQGLVSIIIPSYNRAHLIEDTLNSIINQSYVNWECLVIDDGSTDYTESLLQYYKKKDTRIHYFKRPKDRPKGANACRNFGLEISKGDYINWFDSDDIMHSDKLSIQIQFLETDDYEFSVCKSLLFNNIIGDINELKSKEIISKTPFEDFLTKKIIIPIQAPVFKKSFLINYSLKFDETLHAGQEWEFFARVLINTNHYKAINEPLDYIRRHEKSISGNISLNQKWNYVLARYKISTRYKSRLTPKVKSYLQFFYLKNLKDFLRNENYEEAFFIWKHCLINDKITRLKSHILILCSFVSFFLFKKGDLFLTKVK